MALYLRETGPDAAPTIVFLHGGGVGGWSWEPVVELLPDYHCLVPDMPEQGESFAEGPFSIPDTARRIAEMIRERAHGGRAHLVGLSLGSQVALQLLGSAPELVDRATISGTLVRPIPGRWLIGPILRLYMPFRNIDFLVRLNQRSYDIPDRYLPQFREDTRRMNAGALERVLMENMAFRIPPGLRHLHVPVLAMVGEREMGAVRRSAMEVVATLPNAQARVAPRVGHNWSLEKPDLFARTIRGWVSDGPLPEELLPLT